MSLISQLSRRLHHLFLCLLLSASTMLWADLGHRGNDDPDHQQLTSLAEQLQQKLSQKRYLLNAVSELARQNPDITTDEFEQAARDMFAGNQELMAIQLARNNIVSHIYPLTGNEKTQGHNLMADPNRRQQVQAAIKANSATLAGPYQLRQGGTGLILRLPIYLDAAQTEYWGLAVLVIDWAKLEQQLGLEELRSDLQFAIRSLANDNKAIVLGIPSLFDDPASYRHTLTLPNTRWQLALKTRDDHHGVDGHTVLISVFILGTLLLILISLTLHRKNHWLTPATIAGTFIAMGLTGLTAYNQAQSRTLLLEAHEAANQLRQLIYQRISDNENYLHLLAREYHYGQQSLPDFIERGGRFVADHPELLNLNRVSADLVIKEVTPQKDNAQILGLTISLDAPLQAALLARETRSPTHSRMFKNIQGKHSFETWYPIYNGNRFDGLIAAVYDVDKLVQAVTPATLAERYNVSIRYPANQPHQDNPLDLERELAIPGHGMRLFLSPRGNNLQQETTLLLFILLIVGTGLYMGMRTLQQSNRNLAQRYDELRAARDALFLEKEYSQTTLNSIADGVITLDTDGNIQSLNHTAEQILQLGKDQAIGQPLTRVLSLHKREDTHNSISSLEELLERTLHHTSQNQLHGSIERQSGPLYLHCNASRIEVNLQTVGMVLVLHDVSELTQLASELEYQARHDDLTGLFNRTEFEKRCKQAIRNGQHALLYMDLDQFKLVNDTCGHLAGDHLLTQLSTLLRQQIRPGDTLARLGGDEFGLLLTHCDLSDAEQRAEQIRKTIKEFRFVWDDKVFELGCSIGLVPLSYASGGYDAALARVDLACYIAKDSGRNRIHLFTETDQETSRREGEMSWAARLSAALEQDRFILYQQRIQPVGSDDGQLPSCEMLVRMRDEDGSLVPPGAFLPAAERYHLINALDQRVLELALNFFEQHPETLNELRLFSINLSGQSITNPGFADFVCDRLARSSVPNSKICFEITETAAIARLSEAREFIQRLQRTGAHFALDDFGSGMSSFGYLKQLPANYLKIDGSFVKDITRDPQDRAFVEAINSVAHSMGMGTVAEFVEDDATLKVLEQIGVDHAQGYGIARPAPLHELVLHTVDE